MEQEQTFASLSSLSGTDNIFKNFGFDLTVTPELTSMLSAYNIDYSTVTTADLLSALNLELAKLAETTMQNLSTEVIHPYDAIKLSLFGPDYKFPTIDDIEVPEDINMQSIIDKIKQHEKEYRGRLIDYMHNKEEYEVTGFHDHLSILCELSGEKCFTVTDQRFKNYIETVELLNKINPEEINQDNYLDYYSKIGFCLTKVLGQKTI